MRGKLPGSEESENAEDSGDEEKQPGGDQYCGTLVSEERKEKRHSDNAGNTGGEKEKVHSDGITYSVAPTGNGGKLIR